MSNFVKKILDSDAAKLVKLAGSAATVASVAFSAIEFFTDDSTEQILKRLDQLETLIKDGFKNIGQIIYKQTGVLQEAINKQDVKDAREDTETAIAHLYDYKMGREIAFLVVASDRSSKAVASLKLQTDPSYIGYLIAAGWVRLSVISVRQPNFGADEFRRNEVNEMVSALTSMIESIKRQVDQSHILGYVQPVWGQDPELRWRRELREDGYFYHKHHGQIFRRFSVGGATVPTVISRAKKLAKDARNDGVKAELEFLQVPKYEKIREQWKDLLELSAAIK